MVNEGHLEKSMRKIHLENIMRNLNISQQEAENYINMTSDEQIIYTEAKTGKPCTFLNPDLLLDSAYTVD
jgi:predicted transcriptional regulator